MWRLVQRRADQRNTYARNEYLAGDRTDIERGNVTTWVAPAVHAIQEENVAYLRVIVSGDSRRVEGCTRRTARRKVKC
jgi:hypothetical protein